MTKEELIIKWQKEMDEFTQYAIDKRFTCRGLVHQSRATAISDILEDIKNINVETVKFRETCVGCKYAPRNIWVKVCAECDDWENYEAS